MSDNLKDSYDTTFEVVYNDMLNKKMNDPGFTKQHLKELLQNLYVNEGNNWVGRGEAKEIDLAATIAACEAVLYDWVD